MHSTDFASPWQNGRADRAGGMLKDICQVACEEAVPTNKAEWLACLYVSTGTRNSRCNRGGVTRCQRALGYLPEFPEDVVKKAGVFHLREGPLASVRRASEIRKAAALATSKYDSRERMLRANRAHKRAELPQMVVGQKVCVWRAGRGRAKRGWRGPGVVPAVATSRCSVTTRSSLRKVSREAVRPGTPEEAEAMELVERCLSQYKKGGQMEAPLRKGLMMRSQEREGEISEKRKNEVEHAEPPAFKVRMQPFQRLQDGISWSRMGRSRSMLKEWFR